MDIKNSLAIIYHITIKINDPFLTVCLLLVIAELLAEIEELFSLSTYFRFRSFQMSVEMKRHQLK